ncbi:MAG TPA: YncE family protein [Candidatus Acidoferrum sp.]|nr:YncE family protein [Candidatus Acidoferrum sp.]
MKRNPFFSLLALGMALMTPASLRAAEGPYHLLKEIPVGGASSWDYLSVDEAGRRLYVSHGTEVVVIDIDKDTVAGKIADTPRVHGFAPAPDLGRGVASNGGENKASVVDLKTLETITKLDTERNPDGMLYEPGQHEVYLFNGGSASATVINVKEAKVVATVPLGGKPEFGTADPAAGRVYNNLEDKSAVVVIDTKTHGVVATWPITGGEEPSGMAIDTAHHRLFIGCGGNNKMVMMDSSNGKVITSVPIGAGVDATAFDPGTQLAFASCGGAGTTTIAHEDSPDKLTVVQTLKTENGARTMTVDPKTHKIYLSVGQRNGPPNNFKVLVYEMQKP